MSNLGMYQMIAVWSKKFGGPINLLIHRENHKQCRRIYICLFCVAKRLLGNAPSPFNLHFPMQAAHPFGTLFTR